MMKYYKKSCIPYHNLMLKKQEFTVSQHPKKRSIVKNNKKNENGVLPYDE
jgi:hypothetical protein